MLLLAKYVVIERVSDGFLFLLMVCTAAAGGIELPTTLDFGEFPIQFSVYSTISENERLCEG